MRQQGTAPCDEARQLVLDERFEAAVQQHRGNDGVARLFQPLQQIILDHSGREHGRLPIAFFHPVAVYQMDFAHAELGCSAQYAPQHLRPRQRQYQRHGKFRWRGVRQAHLQGGAVRVDVHQLGGADQPIDLAHLQGIPGFCLQNLPQVLRAPAGHAQLVVRGAFSGSEQQQVHRAISRPTGRSRRRR